MRRSKGQESELRELPQDKLQSQMRLRQKGVGKFPTVENNLLEEIKRRRFQGESYTQTWMKSRMHQLCTETKPSNFDPKKKTNSKIHGAVDSWTGQA